MNGRIIKGIAGFYYVQVKGQGLYECKAKGIFRKEKIKPLVGDFVKIEVLDEEKKLANIEDILERKNDLIRPAVANVDQALVIFSIVKPEPNFNLLDRFLIMMQQQNLETIICFNKQDIATQEQCSELQKIYQECGYQVLFASAKTENGLCDLKKALHGKTTTVAGPSGVGKSSIINCLQEEENMETGSISEKIERGKHTTRHARLLAIDKESYIIDTPGFSSLHMFSLKKEELRDYYQEFDEFEPECRFQGCMHLHEPNCGVKEALTEGKISNIRYQNYKLLFEELKEKEKR